MTSRLPELILATTPEVDSLRAEILRLDLAVATEREKSRSWARAFGELVILAGTVVNERRATINHARETTAMCRLAKAIDGFAALAKKEAT